MNRVLVTGAGGFIGRHTVAPLLAAGYDVHAVSSRPAPGGSSSAGDAGPGEAAGAGMAAAPAPGELGIVRWHHADLLSGESARELVRELRPTHLLHLAWCTEPGRFWTDPANLDWVQASLRLLRAFAEEGGVRAVVAGTCTEYAWGERTHCVERAPQPSTGGDELARSAHARAEWPTSLRPGTLYGAAKHALHVLAERWAEQTGVSLAWGRVFYVYGPHEHPARLASSVARALLSGEEVRCTDGAQVRDYLYAPELAGAFVELLRSDVRGPVNMASGEPVPVAELIRAVAAAAGRPELVRWGALPQRQGDPSSLTADVRRLREEVGWSPSLGLRQGVARTVAWWRRELAGAGASADGADGAGLIPAAAPRTAARPSRPRPASAARHT